MSRIILSSFVLCFLFAFITLPLPIAQADLLPPDYVDRGNAQSYTCENDNVLGDNGEDWHQCTQCLDKEDGEWVNFDDCRECCKEMAPEGDSHLECVHGQEQDDGTRKGGCSRATDYIYAEYRLIIHIEEIIDNTY